MAQNSLLIFERNKRRSKNPALEPYYKFHILYSNHEISSQIEPESRFCSIESIGSPQDHVANDLSLCILILRGHLKEELI
jgi:hypothetical protein